MVLLTRRYNTGQRLATPLVGFDALLFERRGEHNFMCLIRQSGIRAFSGYI